MKTAHKIFIVLLAFVPVHQLEAQTGAGSSPGFSYEMLEKLVMENNQTLQVARDRMDVVVLEARTGNTPPDPEVEFGYLAGRPEGTGSRLDFDISQSFDFPTAYMHRSRLKDEKEGNAALSYEISRQEIILQTKKHWIIGAALNKQAELLGERLKNAELLQEHFKQKLDVGEVGMLSYSQANLQRIALQTAYEELQLGIKKNQLKLDLLVGGNAPFILSSELPEVTALDRDSILLAYESSQEMQYFETIKDIRERQKSLVQSESLPKFSAGYYSETVIDQQFKGVHVGLSIPLWENSNKIKKANSEVIFAESDARRFAAIQQEDVLQKIEQSASLDQQIVSLENALSMVNDAELLHLALESGEISLTEYIYSSELYFQNLMHLQDLKRDRLLVEAELMRVYY